MFALTAGFRTPNKSFLKGLLWGITTGSITMYVYKNQEYKDLQKEYYRLKEQHLHVKYFRSS